MDLDTLAKELNACQACPFRKEAIAPVGWFGNPDSPIVFVGEGPGGVEDAAFPSIFAMPASNVCKKESMVLTCTLS